MVTSTLRFLVRYDVSIKETYETFKHMLSSIEYSKHSWHICADLKVIAVLVGLQAGYTTFFAFCASGIAGYTTFFDFCASGIAGTEKITTSRRCGHATVSHTACEECRERTTSCLRKNSLASGAHQIRFDEESS
ncbi:hypothetical protein AVEN_156656-1 [Araneus ventricosus]|uniref:Uncharacterized protein n=1 Tax=Araneus ventricosus TaxID=182803 RepID=A0A4Y2W7Y2_ARAVE|nr:hypothetical protein AVEN_247321-1 [Araneus ventricosus]GBO33011.1 hypothetical protein AVEN_156656-1 [Araneus ventricosus]